MRRSARTDAEVQTRRHGPIPQIPPEQLFTLQSLNRAWRAIKRAGGGPGVDGVTIARFESQLDHELRDLQMQLSRRTYVPQPLQQVLVPKRGEGLRPLVIWALRDRIAQRAVYDIIAPAFESLFLPCSYGFRSGRSTRDAVTQVERYRDQNLRWIADADIRNCFDEINHAKLMKLVSRRVHDRLLRRYINGWLSAKIFNSSDGIPRKAGASQGSPLSPLLANIYLHELDNRLYPGLHYVRYADDYVICCRRKHDAEKAMVDSQRALHRLGLEIKEEKSRVVHLDQGLTWLGFFLVRNRCYRL